MSQHRIGVDEQRFPLQLRVSMHEFYRYYKAMGLIVTRKTNLTKMKQNFADSSLLQGPARFRQAGKQVLERERKGTLEYRLDKWAQAVNEYIKEEANKTNPTSAEKGKKNQS